MIWKTLKFATTKDSKKHMLLCSRTVNANPIDRHCYKSENVLNEATEKENA